MKLIFTLFILFVSFISFSQDEQLVQVPDVMAEFPGGSREMQKFIVNNIVYPEEAIKNDIKGRLFLRLVIEKDGTISNIKILRGVSKSLDDEAVRVVRLMPKWTPAKFNDVPVRTAVNLPFTFNF